VRSRLERGVDSREDQTRSSGSLERGVDLTMAETRARSRLDPEVGSSVELTLVGSRHMRDEDSRQE
jgi:hypothetical protein